MTPNKVKLDHIYTGDCLEVMKEFPDECIDLVVTSPPYDDLRSYNGYSFDFEGIADQLYRVIKPGGVIVWVVGDQTIDGSESGNSFKQALYFKEIGLNLHDTMIYQKDGATFPDTTRYYQNFEYMFVLSKGKPKTVNLLTKKNKWAGDVITGKSRNTSSELFERSGKGNAVKEYGVRFNVWKYGAGWGKTYTEEYLKGHPAIFPFKLAEDHIESWSDLGDVVLDPFLGSGTTAMMAIKNHRHYVGIEIDPEYVKISKRRISRVQPKLL